MDADVVVIGAGAAGLAAARSLGRRKLRVVLLEARDRIGGRVLSHPIAGIATPAELGAEFIHGPAERTKALLREAGSAAIDMGGDAWVRESGGLRCEEESFASSARIFEGSRSLPDDESVEQFLRRFENDDALRETVQSARAFVEGFEAADPAIASVKAIADEFESGTDSTSARPLGGYGPMFEQLRDDCERAGVAFALSTCVRRVSWQLDGVIVAATDSRGESQTLRARAAVVTLPVGVLRHRGDETEVSFVPELPSAKRAAIAHIEMGHVVKVALAFRTAFWERVTSGRYRDAAFFYIDGQPIPTFWTQLPIRSSWSSGGSAVRAQLPCAVFARRISSRRHCMASGSCSTRTSLRAASSRVASRTTGAPTRLRVGRTATWPSAAGMRAPCSPLRSTTRCSLPARRRRAMVRAAPSTAQLKLANAPPHKQQRRWG
jgi:hypothetical protein